METQDQERDMNRASRLEGESLFMPSFFALIITLATLVAMAAVLGIAGPWRLGILAVALVGVAPIVFIAGRNFRAGPHPMEVAE